MAHLERHELPRTYGPAASPEELVELGYRQCAEKLVDDVHFKVLGISEESDESDEWDLEEREASIVRSIEHGRAIRSYKERSGAEIASDIVSFIDAARADEENGWQFEHAFYRESYWFLNKAKTSGTNNDVDAELLKTTLRWSGVQYFLANYFRGWTAGVDQQKCIAFIAAAGLEVDELDALLQEPCSEQAKAHMREDEELEVYGANLKVLEEKMLERAMVLKMEIGKVHPYAAQQTRLGI